MPSAVRLREDYSAAELRVLARRSKDVNQSRRLLSLAAVRDGMDRGGAARASCAWVESERDSRISEILIQPVGWAEASRRWQSRIRKTCVTA